MTYGFRKLYADLVADDGTVCIAYASWLDVMGLSFPYAGLERYEPTGARRVVRARRARFTPLHDASSPFVVRLDLPDGVFELRYTSPVEPFAPATPVHPDGLDWTVRIPRAACEGRWVDRPGGSVLHGTGYADWVELRRLTRSFAMRRLQWGRLHLEDESVVFNVVQFRSGAEWRRLVRVAAGGTATSTDDFAAAWDDDGLHLRPAGQAAAARPASYGIRPQRVLHEGPAIDRARFPGRIERRVFSAITGPNHETRWLSRVYRDEEPAASGWAVHEEVAFGPGAAATMPASASASQHVHTVL